MTVSIESLTERFGPALDVPKLGKCLAIPGSEFDPDWEVLLGDQGFEVIFETWDNHPMTVVPLKIHGNEGKKVEVVPVKVDGADVLVDLVKNYQILSEAYEKLNTAYVELTEDFEAYAKLQSEIVEANREDLKVLTAKCRSCRKNWLCISSGFW